MLAGLRIVLEQNERAEQREVYSLAENQSDDCLNLVARKCQLCRSRSPCLALSIVLKIVFVRHLIPRLRLHVTCCSRTFAQTLFDGRNALKTRTTLDCLMRPKSDGAAVFCSQLNYYTSCQMAGNLLICIIGSDTSMQACAQIGHSADDLHFTPQKCQTSIQVLCV